jgi:hypothetical protein
MGNRAGLLFEDAVHVARRLCLGELDGTDGGLTRHRFTAISTSSCQSWIGFFMKR